MLPDASVTAIEILSGMEHTQMVLLASAITVTNTMHIWIGKKRVQVDIAAYLDVVYTFYRVLHILQSTWQSSPPLLLSIIPLIIPSSPRITINKVLRIRPVFFESSVECISV